MRPAQKARDNLKNAMTPGAIPGCFNEARAKSTG